MAMTEQERRQWADFTGPITDATCDPTPECPYCGEYLADFIIFFDDGEYVKCPTCGKVFRPGATQ